MKIVKFRIVKQGEAYSLQRAGKRYSLQRRIFGIWFYYLEGFDLIERVLFESEDEAIKKLPNQYRYPERLTFIQHSTKIINEKPMYGNCKGKIEIILNKR